MVAYAMGITELDPLEHGLIFERFLNPERVSLPDIDVDFDPDGRGRVLDYVGEKYGRDKVAQCVIYGTIKTKQALKDSARIMGYDFSVGDKITKALPPAQTGGKDIPLHDIFDPSAKRYAEAREFRELYDSDPDAKRITDEAMGIEGLIRPDRCARLRHHHGQRADHQHVAAAGTYRRAPSPPRSNTIRAKRSVWSRWTSSDFPT